MADNNFDLVVIGSGPGGYVCAIRGAQLGLKTALIEKDANLGGTCLNVGCIPSKALLHSTEIYHTVDKHADTHGIKSGKLSIDIPGLMKNKDGVVNKLRQGVAALTSKRGIEIIKGKGVLKGDGKIDIEGENKSTITAKNIVIATGSSVVEIPALPFDGDKIVSSDQAIAFSEVPKKMIVVGGGAIGLELGSVWSRLGTEVTVIEFLPNIAPGCDPDVSKILSRSLGKQGLKFELETKVTGVAISKSKVTVTAEKKGKPTEFDADKVLVSVGRKPYTDGLGLENVGIKTNERGFIEVDSHLKTPVAGIYAIGDVTPGPMLAHKAEEEGVAVAELIAGKAGHVNYDVIPNVIYTEPEVASVGIGETGAKDKGIKVKVGKFPIAANGRAIASDATDGIVKVIACAETDKLLGVQVVSRNASEIIGSAVTHMEYGGSTEDMARTIAAHPTISETLKEAAMAVEKMSIHSL